MPDKWSPIEVRDSLEHAAAYYDSIGNAAAAAQARVAAGQALAAGSDDEAEDIFEAFAKGQNAIDPGGPMSPRDATEPIDPGNVLIDLGDPNLRFDDQGNPIPNPGNPILDDQGNPILDDQGNPIPNPGNPILDDQGNPILDDQGNPILDH